MVAVGDVVYTPTWIAQDMVDHFQPTGTILDPCRGLGAFHDLLPEGSPWCEITDGRDFFDWTDPVDWIISNPPYSKSSQWFAHSFALAEHVCYVMPLRHMFSAYGRLRDLAAWGGVREIRLAEAFCPNAECGCSRDMRSSPGTSAGGDPS